MTTGRWVRGGFVIALVAMATMGLPGVARSSPAVGAPLRSGTIVGGPDTMGSAPCGLVPECAAWLQSGCNPALAGRDPALHSSIVDVTELADGTTRRVFEYTKAVLWSGVFLQFWDDSCSQLGDCLGVDTNVPGDDPAWAGLDAPLGCRGAEMRESALYDSSTWKSGGGEALAPSRFTTLEIPEGARWMTVGGSAAVNVRWALSTAAPVEKVVDERAMAAERCARFPTWNDAQVWFETRYPGSGDVGGLDHDGDGVPCEDFAGAPGHWQYHPYEGGYVMAEANGTVFGFGDLRPLRNIVTEPTVAIAMGPEGGYWVLGASGTVHARGLGRHHGDAIGLRGDRVTSIAGRPDGSGYWVFTAGGRVLPFGSARSFGDMSGVRLNGPIVAAVATPSGNGYWMVGSDGGLFSFGDARFSGSTGGLRLNRPVVGMAADPDGLGYWLVAGDGGIFAFDAPFRGSVPGVLAPGQQLNRPVIGAIAYGDGYVMVAADGGIFSFSDRPFFGSLGSTPPPNPIVGVAARWTVQVSR
jgi:hypothetical protein